MSKRLSLIIVLLMLFSIMSCHNKTKGEENTGFKDEKSMRNALAGTWILKEYQDSIDAGQTPNQLEYINNRWDELIYNPESNKLVIEEHGASEDVVGTAIVNYGDSSLVRFDPRNNRLTFYAFFEEYRHRLPLVDSAELMYIDGDTILRIYRDTVPIDLIKYDQGACEWTDPYEHLFRSRFIAGIYYNKNDPQHLHHIILTKCGDVEGSEFISSSLRSYHNYGVETGPDFEGKNRIHFLNENDHRMDAEAISVEWTINKDTLRIDGAVLIKSTNRVRQ